MYTIHPHLWGIVLAGGDGRRLQPFIRARFGCDRPKQYCTFFGERSMLQQTRHRISCLIVPQRCLTVISQAHLPYTTADLGDCQADTILVQPCNRDTGVGILLPLLHILQRDPAALVALFPSDHFIVGEERFMDAVAAATAFVERTPERLVLLGIPPTRPEVEYGWIVPGELLGEVQGDRCYAVRRFVEKPSLPRAQRLLRRGAVWNTMIVIGRATLLLRLFARLTPMLVAAFASFWQVVDLPEAKVELARVYATLPAVNFSQAILVPSTPHLAVLPVPDIYWSDWGNAQRLQHDLVRFGLTAPAWSEGALA